MRDVLLLVNLPKINYGLLAACCIVVMGSRCFAGDGAEKEAAQIAFGKLMQTFALHASFNISYTMNRMDEDPPRKSYLEYSNGRFIVTSWFDSERPQTTTTAFDGTIWQNLDSETGRMIISKNSASLSNELKSIWSGFPGTRMFGILTTWPSSPLTLNSFGNLEQWTRLFSKMSDVEVLANGKLIITFDFEGFKSAVTFSKPHDYYPVHVLNTSKIDGASYSITASFKDICIQVGDFIIPNKIVIQHHKVTGEETKLGYSITVDSFEQVKRESSGAEFSIPLTAADSIYDADLELQLKDGATQRQPPEFPIEVLP
jgi:hypothetical protein